LAGVIFYYGLPRIVFLVFFLYNLWARLDNKWMKLLLLAPLLYSVGKCNLRNWFLWVGLAVLYIAAKNGTCMSGRSTPKVASGDLKPFLCEKVVRRPVE